MKKLAACFFAATLSAGAQAQCYSTSSIPYSPSSYSGTQVILPDDGWSGPIPIGFTFCYYGFQYGSLLIGSNGMVSFDIFDAPPNGFCQWTIFTTVPNPAPPPNPRNCIMLPWQDLSPPIVQNVNYSTAGTAPNRVFVVSFDSVMMYACWNMYFKGQIKLFETTNIIETHIEHKDLCATWNAGRAIHALHNRWGSMATVVAGRNSPSQWTANNEGTRFTPTCNACSSISVNELEGETAFHVFPNPARDEITVSVASSAQGKHDVALINLLGVTVLSRSFSGNETWLNTEGLSRGIYFLELKGESKPGVTLKIILE